MTHDSVPFVSTRVHWFSPGSYREVWELQREVLTRRIAGETVDTVLVGEHERVFTAGRATRELPSDLPAPIHEIERGGQITWHGPGQLVAYPILSLKTIGIGVRDYLVGLEHALIATLAGFGIDGERRDGATGVWVGPRKIASIGVALRRHVSWHGIALNRSPDFSDFHAVQPCGFAPDVMTSIERERSVPPPTASVLAFALVRELAAEFSLAPPIWDTSPPENAGGAATSR